ETGPGGAELAGSGSAGRPPAPAPEATPEQPQRQSEPEPEPQEQKAEPAPQEEKAEPAPRAEQPPAEQPRAEEPPAGEDGGYVTPLVRKLASEHRVDLSKLRGTGVGGRIRKQDVLEAAERERAAAAAKPEPAPAKAAPAAKPEPSPLRGRTEKLTRMRATIARRMVESLQTSAQLTTVVEVDITRIARLRDRAKADFQQREGVKLSFLPFFALAAVEALRVHP